MKKLFTLIVLAMVLVGLAFSAEAGVKKIRPDQLKAQFSYDIYEQSPERVRSMDGTECYWTAVVKLPVGKRITRLKYYHSGNGSTPLTSVVLYRVKMGEGIQQIANTGGNDTTGSIIPCETTSINFPTIKSGYTYYVAVWSYNSNSRIHGIKIIYQD